MYLGGFKESLQHDKNRRLVSRSLPCPIDRSKEVVFDNLLQATKPPIQVLPGSQRKGINFS